MANLRGTGRGAVLADAWRTKLWPLPTACVLLSVAAAIGLPELDRLLNDLRPDSVSWYLFSGGPEAARTVLSAIAGSMITVTSLTFSLTVVTLQLASSQFSPRLLRTFARDRVVQSTLGLFLATFAYSLVVLRTVRSDTGGGLVFVPRLSTTVAVLLALASVLALVLFLGHLARQIRIETVLETVREETGDTIASNVPEEGDDPGTQPAWVAGLATHQSGGDVVIVPAGSSGFLAGVHGEALLEAAVDLGAVLLVDRRPGDSVVAGTPVAFAAPLRPGGPLDAEELCERVRSALIVGPERTAPQDVAFGLRQIVDVAAKALSPGINDPTTAVHALGHLSALLCELARRPLVDQLARDEDGAVRVVLRRYDFASLLELAVSQPRRYGTQEPVVLARILQLLREVAWCVQDPERAAVVREELERTRRVARESDLDESELARLLALAGQAEAALHGRWLPSAGS